MTRIGIWISLEEIKMIFRRLLVRYNEFNITAFMNYIIIHEYCKTDRNLLNENTGWYLYDNN